MSSVCQARTVCAILRRHRMPYLRDCDPLTGAVIRASKTTAVRYERNRPGELIHMDVKKIGRIPDGGGWKAHGRAATGDDHAHKKSHIGFDYVHSVIDDHSRLAYSEILSDEKGITCAAFLQRAADYFATYGITQIERIMTDNAWAYRYSLREVVAALGARQVFIKPHCVAERQSGALQPHPASRMGLPRGLQHQRRPLHSPYSLARALQQSTAPLSHRGKPPISRLSPT